MINADFADQKLFHDTFNRSMTSFADPIATFAAGKFKFDIFKLDELLFSRGYTISVHGSSSDFIKLKYGDRVEAMIRKYV